MYVHRKDAYQSYSRRKPQSESENDSADLTHAVNLPPTELNTETKSENELTFIQKEEA